MDFEQQDAASWQDGPAVQLVPTEMHPAHAGPCPAERQAENTPKEYLLRGSLKAMLDYHLSSDQISYPFKWFLTRHLSTAVAVAQHSQGYREILVPNTDPA